MGENSLTGDRIYRHQHQSQNVEETNTNTSTNPQHNIVDIEAYFASDNEGSAVGGASLEGTADTDVEVDPTLRLRKNHPLLLLFSK